MDKTCFFPPFYRQLWWQSQDQLEALQQLNQQSQQEEYSSKMNQPGATGMDFVLASPAQAELQPQGTCAELLSPRWPGGRKQEAATRLSRSGFIFNSNTASSITAS